MIAYLVVLLDTYAFYFITLVTYSFSDAFCATLGLLYSGLFLVVIYYGFRATAADPTDPTILKQREMKEAGLKFDGSGYKFFCEVCEAYVNDHSKHCGSCNRCVNNFDHHCRWLNNCIGAANYQFFFRLIVAVLLMTIVHTGTDIAVLVYVNSGDKRFISDNIKVRLSE